MKTIATIITLAFALCAFSAEAKKGGHAKKPTKDHVVKAPKK